MAIMIPNASQVTLGQYMLGVATPANQLMKLFVNNVVPALTDTAVTYTEMSTNGYAAFTLTKGNWNVTAGSGTASGTQGAVTFTFTAAGGANTVYGYFVTDSVSGLLLWSEAFSVAKLVQYVGDQIIITPTLNITKI